jgi:hypothetical protein
VTRSQTRALQGGTSLSALLQARSEATAAGSRRQARTAAAQQQRPGSPLPDIDATDRGNPLAACDYVNDVYGFYRRVEPQFRVPGDYMSQQVGGGLGAAVLPSTGRFAVVTAGRCGTNPQS